MHRKKIGITDLNLSGCILRHAQAAYLPPLSLETANSFRWLEGVTACDALRQNNVKVIQVCGRGADIFEFLGQCKENQQSFVVRAKSDRLVEVIDPIRGQVQEHLFSHIETAPIVGKVRLSVCGNSKREAKEIDCVLQKATVTCHVPTSNRTANLAQKLSPITLNVVKISSHTLLDGKKTSWVLLTSEPINSYKDLKNISNIYALRWRIEVLFKVFKTGCKIEECRLNSLEKLGPFLMMKLVLAFRVMQLTYCCRSEPDLQAKNILESEEIQAIEILLYKDHKGKKPMNIKEVVKRIACYGGYMPSGQKFPGILTIWRGWEEITRLVRFMDLLNHRALVT